jgi:Ser/Thr protein kinase RdoA (MazF antagonist)
VRHDGQKPAVAAELPGTPGSAPPAVSPVPADLAHELERALAAYGLAGPARPVTSGLINRTFAVEDHGRAAARPGEPVAVLQRLHPVFAAEVNLDIDAVTAHLAAHGMETPALLRTVDGARWYTQPGGVWRALSYVPGTTLHRIEDPETARTAGELVGRFHRALDPLAHDYAFTRAGVHDTPAHLARLRARVEAGDAAGGAGGDAAELVRAGRALGRDVLAAAAALAPLPALPARHTHGDLKISNVLFFPGDTRRARCLVDLDTLSRQTMAYELGDAMRSWCNPRGEDETEARVDEAIFAAAMTGYRSGAGGLPTAAERAAIVPGLETVCVELAARFCADVFDDAYFGWDTQRYPSRRAHNLVRARGQLALARSVRAARRSLEALV